MNNTSLFNFKFVDRDIPKNEIRKMLDGRTESNVIWMQGSHGVGKTFLIEHITDFTHFNNKIYVDIDVENENPNCLLSLLETISQATQFSFLAFFKENYFEFIKIVKDAAIFTTEKLTGIDIGVIVDSMFDSAKLFVEKKRKTNEQQSAQKLLVCYINEILKKQDLLIVLDNFSLCDKKSLPLIINLISNFLNYNSNHSTKIFFIISTTSEDDIQNNYVSSMLKEQIPINRLVINTFDSSKYFTDILGNIFNLELLEPVILDEIFKFCEGNPQKLINLIHKLYDSGGIIYNENESKAIIVKEILNEIFKYGTTEFLVSELTHTERIVVSIIISFGKIISVKFLISIVKYVLKHLDFYPYASENEIRKSIFTMLNNGKIKIIKRGNCNCVKIAHDLSYHNLKKQLINDPFIIEINALIYRFLLQNKELFFKENYSEDDYNETLAKHGFISKTGNWITLNLECGKTKYLKGLYEDSKIYFEHIKTAHIKLSVDDLKIIADCYYHTGDYINSQKILKFIFEKTSYRSFELYCLFAKVENLLLNKKHAADLAEDATKLDGVNRGQFLYAKMIKMQCLINSNDNRKEAKKIFEDLKKDFDSEFIDTIEYGFLLLSTVEFNNGNEAQTDLKVAEQIALREDNQFLLGEIYFNMGFDDFWEGDFEKSKKNFYNSYKYLSRVRPHEASYPLNNLASYFMIKGDVEKAIFCLNNASLWVTSNYASFVIKTQLMVCYAIIMDTKCLSLAEELKTIYEQGILSDISVDIKFNYNLGFVYNRMGREYEGTCYIKNAQKAANSTSLNSLPHSLVSELSKENIANKSKLSKCDVDFDPWLLTINH